MSGRRGPSRRTIFNGLDRVEEFRIETAIREVRRISEDDDMAPRNWEERIRIARTAMETIDSTRFMDLPNRSQERIFVIGALQRLAYHDADVGGVADIAQWCVTQWLRMLQQNADDLDALCGLSPSTRIRLLR